MYLWEYEWKSMGILEYWNIGMVLQVLKDLFWLVVQ